MKLLEGKIALVTGATRGIGKAIAQEFVNQGATVVFTFRSSVEKAKALEQELTANGGTCVGIQSDAADFEATQAVVKTILDTYKRIDVVVIGWMLWLRCSFHPHQRPNKHDLPWNFRRKCPFSDKARSRFR